MLICPVGPVLFPCLIPLIVCVLWMIKQNVFMLKRSIRECGSAAVYISSRPDCCGSSLSLCLSIPTFFLALLFLLLQGAGFGNWSGNGMSLFIVSSIELSVGSAFCAGTGAQ